MASLKSAAKKRKSSSIRQFMSKIEMQEESSTEIIVNSTSILSLSSEAAQLTVKNGSIDSSQSGNSSRSSDEVSITYRNLELLNSQQQPTGVLKSAHALSDSLDQNSVDSDDTSYAKAISQTVVSEVMPVLEGTLPLCHSHRTQVYHACCHHHHHPHHVNHEHCHASGAMPPSKSYHEEDCPLHQAALATGQYAEFAHIHSKGELGRDVVAIRVIDERASLISADNSEKLSRRKRRTQSFGGFLQGQHEEHLSFKLLSSGLAPASAVTSASGNSRHTATSPVRTCSSVENTLNVVDSSDISSSASYIRLFPYLNRSASIDQTQPLRSGQSCPQVRCDIVEYL